MYRPCLLALCAALLLPLTARAAIPDGKIKVGILDSVAGPYAARMIAPRLS